MSAYPPIRHFKDAADYLAHEFTKRQFRDSITDRDAAEYVSADVAAGWIAREVSLQSPVGVLHDLLDHVTDAEAAALLAALTHQDGPTQIADLSRVLHERVAYSLAYEAEKIVAESDTGDDTYDPTTADRRALAREVNAGLRAARVQP